MCFSTHAVAYVRNDIDRVGECKMGRAIGRPKNVMNNSSK